MGLAGAAALGAAGGAAVYALGSSVPEAAAVNLHNFVAGCDDPGALKREDIEGVAKRFGLLIDLDLVRVWSEMVCCFVAKLVELEYCEVQNTLGLIVSYFVIDFYDWGSFRNGRGSSGCCSSIFLDPPWICRD